MEFCETLQKLRKSRGLTQEELAEMLYVSRTAISKWESGRGYPSIDSLRAIASLFSVTVDELLSGERLLSLAENENKTRIRGICDLLRGLLDLFSLVLVILPLYPNTVNGFVYSVGLRAYTEVSPRILAIYWTLFLALSLCGAVQLVLVRWGNARFSDVMAGVSVMLGIATVLLLALTREAYALIVVFLLLVGKAVLLWKRK